MASCPFVVHSSQSESDTVGEQLVGVQDTWCCTLAALVTEGRGSFAWRMHSGRLFGPELGPGRPGLELEPAQLEQLFVCSELQLAAVAALPEKWVCLREISGSLEVQKAA